MKVEIVYRCSWCTWLFKGIFSEKEWEQLGKKPHPVIEHHCRGEANRHGVANLVGWKEVEDEEAPEGERKAEEGKEEYEAMERNRPIK